MLIGIRCMLVVCNVVCVLQQLGFLIYVVLFVLVSVCVYMFRLFCVLLVMNICVVLQCMLCEICRYFVMVWCSVMLFLMGLQFICFGLMWCYLCFMQWCYCVNGNLFSVGVFGRKGRRLFILLCGCLRFFMWCDSLGVVLGVCVGVCCRLMCVIIVFCCWLSMKFFVVSCLQVQSIELCVMFSFLVSVCDGVRCVFFLICLFRMVVCRQVYS